MTIIKFITFFLTEYQKNDVNRIFNYNFDFYPYIEVRTPAPDPNFRIRRLHYNPTTKSIILYGQVDYSPVLYYECLITDLSSEDQLRVLNRLKDCIINRIIL